LHSPGGVGDTSAQLPFASRMSPSLVMWKSFRCPSQYGLLFAGMKRLV
jgi:hypothetical protein